MDKKEVKELFKRYCPNCKKIVELGAFDDCWCRTYRDKLYNEIECEDCGKSLGWLCEVEDQLGVTAVSGVKCVECVAKAVQEKGEKK